MNEEVKVRMKEEEEERERAEGGECEGDERGVDGGGG